MVKFNNLAGDQSISNTAIERANDVPFYEESEPRDADTLGGLEPSFYSNNSNYILNEIVVGSYKGKPLYRRGIDIVSLPNATSGSYPHGATNVLYILSVYGMSFDGTNYRPLPFIYPTVTATISIYATTTNIVIDTGLDRRTLSATVFVEYTKTTD
jgi:hypothetical protein